MSECPCKPIWLRIVQDYQVVADMPAYTGPIPLVGDFIEHPPLPGIASAGVAGRVKSRLIRTHDRDGNRFVAAATPYVELTI